MRRLALVFTLATLFSCKCGEEPSAMLDDGGGAGTDGTIDDGDGSIGGGDGGPTMTFCKESGETCAEGMECCTLICSTGQCSTTFCNGMGQACANGTECCSTICGANGLCEAVPAGPGGDTCKTLGENCNEGGECCSTNCRGGLCVRAYSCQANGDICRVDDDCCGHACSAEMNSVGRCQMISGGGGGGCTQGGNPCPSGGSNCCSRICVDLGSGVPVCQIASGCTLTGEFCKNDDQCCGGGMNPNGTVDCDPGTSRCDNGQACNPVGNICGAPVLPSGGSINASQDCCDGKKEVCKLDSSGIPRCFGGCPGGNCGMDCPTGYDPNDPNCCIASGQACQFRDQCCNYLPCIPSPNGGFVCAEMPMCIELGGMCTPNVDPMCCAGACLPAAGGGNACQEPMPDPGNGGDGGVADGSGSDPDAAMPPPPCSPNGVACMNASECCSAICDNGTCGAPAVCQPEGSVCTASTDCCAGLSCEIPPGMGSGTCVSNGSMCSNVGQQCSSSVACCPPLECDNLGMTTPCDGTTTCACVIHL